jgi:hypothetical protein
MTVAGALLGASIANDNERVGYKVVNKQICDTKYHYRSEKRFSHYIVFSSLIYGLFVWLKDKTNKL